jgi:putative aminopeptidase FrvX
MRGAAVGAFSAEPALAIALDATHARTPDAKKGETLPMGRGAAIGVGPNMNRRVTEELIALAKESRSRTRSRFCAATAARTPGRYRSAAAASPRRLFPCR